MANGIFFSANDLKNQVGMANKYIHDLVAASNAANGYKPSDPQYMVAGSGDKVISQYEIRTEQLLNPNTNIYKFALIQNQNQGALLQPGETRIQQQDIFICLGIQYYIRIQSTGSNQTWQYMLNFGPDAIFNGMGGVISSYLQYGFWNGRISLNMNGRNIIEDWALKKHMETPTTQSPIYATFVNTAEYPLSNEKYGSVSGLYPCYPMLPIDGSSNAQLQVQYDSSLATIYGTANPTIYAGMYLQGLRGYNLGKIINPNIPIPH